MSSVCVTNFFSKKLQQALSVREITQNDMALYLGVSKGTVSKWISGTQKPTLNAIKKMALILKVKPILFTTPFYTALKNVHFRRQSKALGRKYKSLKSEMEWAEEITEKLQVYLDLPEIDFPLYRFACCDEITDQDIEKTALECRRRWELKEAPIQDLLLAVEGAGGIVVRKKTQCSAITGFSGWSDWIERPLIFLSSDKNAYENRLDLAREIGHLCLHAFISRGDITHDHKLAEEQAGRFARALLLPARTFSKDIPDTPRVGDFLLLKRKWGVCVATIIKRLRQLELIGEQKERYFLKRKNVLWGNVSEPGDDKLPPEEPRILRRSLNLLLENNILVPNHAADYFGLSNDDLKALMYLPDNYFSTFDNPEHNIRKLRFK